MKRKKIVTLCLVGILIVSALVGCGSSKNSETETKDTNSISNEEKMTSGDETEAVTENGVVFPLEETMEFTAMNMMSGEAYLGDSPAWQELCERANISVKLTEVKSAETSEKVSTVLGGGNYPDFFFKTLSNSSRLYELGTDGIIIPLEDLIKDYAPNLTALLDEYDAWQEITEADGHIYSLPQIYAQNEYWSPRPAWINQKWLDNLGLEMPTSMEELYQVLKAFKEEDANGNGDKDDEIPFTLDTNTFTPNMFLAYAEDGCHYFDIFCAVMDGEFVFYPFTDEFKDNYLGYLRMLYTEGILDQDAFTQNLDQSTLKSKSGDVTGMFFRSASNGQVIDEYAMDYVTLPPFVEENFPLTHGISKGGMSITDKCEHPEVLIAWLDYLYSEEGGRLAYFGVEGEHYEVLEDGTYAVVMPEGKTVIDWRIQGYGVTPMKMPDLFLYPNEEATPLDAYIRSQTYTGLYLCNGTFLPTLIYTDEENNVIADKWTAISEYLTTYTAQVVTGQLDLENSWEDFQSTLKKMGADELYAVRKATYERATK